MCARFFMQISKRFLTNWMSGDEWENDLFCVNHNLFAKLYQMFGVFLCTKNRS